MTPADLLAAKSYHLYTYIQPLVGLDSRIKCAAALKLNTVQIHFFSTELGDPDILHLSERITNRDELMKLGVDVLKMPHFKIKSALYDHRDSINSAAHKVLSEWRVQQENPYKAYNTLMSSLAQHNMSYLLTREEEPTDSSSAKIKMMTESKYLKQNEMFTSLSSLCRPLFFYETSETDRH